MEEEIRIPEGTSLDEAQGILLDAELKGKHVYCNYQGHELHSNNLGEDVSYLKTFGSTKTEYEKVKESWGGDLKREQEEALKRFKIAVEQLSDSTKGKSK